MMEVSSKDKDITLTAISLLLCIHGSMDFVDVRLGKSKFRSAIIVETS